jgi:MFS family permease
VNLGYARLLSSFYVATFSVRFSFGISLITFAAYVSEASNVVYGLVVSASPLVEIMTVLWVGVAIDKYGRRNFLLAGLGIASLGLFGLALTRDTLLLAALKGVHGFAAGLILVSSLALIADYAARGSRGREMGVFDFVNLFGWILGITLGFVFLNMFRDNLSTTFLVSGSVALAGLAYAWFNVHEPKQEQFVSERKDVGLKAIREALGQRRIAFLILPWFAVFLLISSALAFIPRALNASQAPVDTAHATSAVTSLSVDIGSLAPYILVGGVVFLATQIVFGRLSDKYGRIPLMFIGSAGFAVATTIAAVVVLATPHPRGEMPTAALQAALPFIGIPAFLSLAFGPSALAALADAAAKKAHGTTMSLYSLVVSAGWTIGAPLVGLLNDSYGVDGVVAVFAIAGCSMPAFVFLLHREMRKPIPAQQEAAAPEATG